MKIEMGESLIYSWLRHVKQCQLAQTNWKASSSIWALHNEADLNTMFDDVNAHFVKTEKSTLFKKTTSLTQLLKQGECDALGLAVENGNLHFFAVDVAFHENGLNYGSKKETILKVIAKCVRTAFCLHAFFDARDADIIFASPFASINLCAEIKKHLADLNTYFSSKGLSFRLELVCNADFNTQILEPTLIACKSVADTSELFSRAYKLIDLFAIKSNRNNAKGKSSNTVKVVAPSQNTYAQMKPGYIARTALRNVLASGNLTKQDVSNLQDKDFCVNIFGVGYPLLALNRDPARYYSDPVNIDGKDYYICNDWYDRNKQALIDWIQNQP